MEHSRLLKFFKYQRDIHISSKMAEAPAYKVQIDYQSPENVESEVPGSQEIRELDKSVAENTVIEEGYTLSPVITITKNEATLTKGDMKLQKVTVTEDVSIEDSQDGQSVTRTYTSSVQQNGKTVTRMTSISGNKHDATTKHDKHHAAKRSKIPMLKFKQTVEKVQKENKSKQKKEDVDKRPRKSSIPKLRNSKLTAVKDEAIVKEQLATEDEFDKIYDEIVDDTKMDIDDKVLAVKLEDPEKLESKFEELMHSYEEEESNYSDKIRQSRIPALRRKKIDSDGANRLSSLVNNIRLQNAVRNSKELSIEDEFGEVTTRTITTKRFIRGESTDGNNVEIATKVDIRNNSYNINQDIGNEVSKNEQFANARNTDGTRSLTKVTRVKKGTKIDLNDNDITPDNVIQDNYKQEVTTTRKIVTKTTKIDSPEVNKGTTTETVTIINIAEGNMGPENDNIIKTRKILKEITRTGTPVLAEVTTTNQGSASSNNVTVNVNQDSGITKTETITMKERTIDTPVNVITVDPKIESDNINEDITKQRVLKPQEILNESKINTQSINRVKNIDASEINDTVDTNRATKEVTTIQRNRGGIPVLSKEKISKIITTQTSTLSDISNQDSYKNITENILLENSKIIKDDINKPEIVKEITKANRSEVNNVTYTENVDATENNNHSNKNDSQTHEDKKEIMVTEQIVKESIKIGIPEFTKIITNTKLVAKASSENRDVKESDSTKENLENQDITTSPKITQATCNYTQETIRNVELNKDVELTGTTTNKNIENTYTSVHQEQSNSNNTINKKPNEINSDIEDQVFVNKRFDVTEKNTIVNIKAVKDTNNSDILLEEKDKDQYEVTVLKGNVSRLINRMITRENETNKNTLPPDGIQTEQVHQERVKRLDKMISNFNKFDYKNKENKEHIMIKKDTDDVIYSQDKEVNKEEVAFVKGNVSRMINNLREKEFDIITKKDDIQNTANETTNLLDVKNNSTFVISHEKQINEDDTITSIVKIETVNSTNATEGRESTSIVKTSTENFVLLPDTAIETPTRQTEDTNIKVTKRDNNMKIEKIAENERNYKVTAALNEDNAENLIKGNVTRLINKITKSNITETSVKNYEDELPKKKTVLSKIAIFENLEPKEPYPKTRPHSEKKLSKLVIKDININNKPRIVDEILKDHAKLTSNYNYDKGSISIGVNETLRVEPIIVNEVWKTTLSKDRKVQDVTVTQTNFQETIHFKTNNEVEVSTCDNIAKIDSVTDIENVKANIHFISDKDGIEITTAPSDTDPIEDSERIYEGVKYKHNIYEQNVKSISRELSRSESREYRLKSEAHNFESSLTDKVTDEFNNEALTEKSININHDSNMNTADYGVDEYVFDNPNKFKSKEDLKRAKSVAEIDLGDAVKGQVHRMVYRIKSVDFDRSNDATIKTEKISIKEMPKKSSVLEKIALFESKVASARSEMTTDRSPRVSRTTPKPVVSEEEYQHKIAELASAKSTYGTVQGIPSIPLGDGNQLPVLALGTALLDPRLIPHIIGAAIDLGYRAIDTAYIYGNEKEIGEGIKAKIDDGTVKREDLYIMSKLWSTYHNTPLVETACNASLHNLGLTYFDLYLIHNPMSFKEGGDPIPRIATVMQYSEHDYLDAWFGMEKVFTKGLAKSIGVSNFNSVQIQRILDKGRVKPVVNQVECHTYLSQQRLHEFCAARNITLSCFGVLGSKGTPAEYKSSVPPAIDEPLVQVMAKGLNVSSAQLLIRYQIQSGHNVIVKSSSAAHLQENLNALNFTLTDAQMAALATLNRNKRIFTFAGMGDTHKNYPFKAAF